jgi:hypothetical protein
MLKLTPILPVAAFVLSACAAGNPSLHLTSADATSAITRADALTKARGVCSKFGQVPDVDLAAIGEMGATKIAYRCVPL